MKWTKKQELYSQSKIEKSIFNLRKTMFMLVLLIVGAFAAYSIVTEGFGKNLGILTVATVIPMVNLSELEAKEKQGNKLKNKVYLLRMFDEVDKNTFPDGNEQSNEIGQVYALAGKYWHYIDAINNTVTWGMKNQDGSLMLEILANFGGVSKDALTFIQTNNGSSFVIVIEDCYTGQKYLAGTTCSGMTMEVVNAKMDATGSGVELKFTTTCPYPLYSYTGTVSVKVPTAVNTSATLALCTDTDYQLTNTEVEEVFACSGVSNGQVFTLRGNSGMAATIEPGGDFLLSGGITWTASAGKMITFKCFLDTTMKFVEVSRV